MRRKIIAVMMIMSLVLGMCGTVFAEEGPDYYGMIFNEVRRTAPWMGDEGADWTARAILWSCGKWGVDPKLATALIKQESGFSMNARSSVGAIGATQLMPETAEGLGVNPYNPLENIDGGIHYLRIQLDRFNAYGEWAATYAVAAYNAGPGAVLKYGGVPPYRETVNYVACVSRNYQELE